MRYVYFYSKSRDKAEDAMEDAFAYGEISWSDEPKIEKRGVFWCLTLLDRTYA